MRTTAIALFALMTGTVAAQDDAEAKKKRLGQIMKQLSQLQAEGEKLLKELSGGDRSKYDAIMKEIAEKYAPEMAADMGRAQTAANERNASATLKTFAAAEADFRSNDRDNNRINDFWVADVSGLFRVDAGGAIKLIEQSAAGADARPCVPLDQAGPLPGAAKEHAAKLVALGKPSPKAGYWFVAVEKYEDEKGATAKYNDGSGRNNSRFGCCAYPAEYGKSGRMTFMLCEENVVWMKDTAGKPVEVFPDAPDRAGWRKLD